MDKEKNRPQRRDTARRIWLAGIGAYGRAFSKTRDALKSISGETAESFDELVRKGEKLESAVGLKSKEMLSETGMAAMEVPDLNLDNRIRNLRAKLKSASGLFETSGDEVPEDENKDSFVNRLDWLESKMDQILDLLHIYVAQPGNTDPDKSGKTIRTKKTASSPRKNKKKTVGSDELDG